MNIIPISREFLGLIESGTKTTTIRRGKRTYPLGPAIMRSEKGEISIYIKNIEFKRFKDLNDADAARDGSEGIKHLRSTLRRFYPSISDEDEVTIVEFRKK